MTQHAIDPQRTALIIVDMQNCFVHGSPVAAPEGPALLTRINQLAAACRAAGMLVVVPRLVLRPDRSNAGLLAEHPLVMAGIIDKGAASAEIHRELDLQPTDIVLEKPRFGAFHGTDLELILRSRGIDTVIISGIASNVCCDTTAREAAARDFRVLFLKDGTATFGVGDWSAEELREATCATIELAFGRVASIDEVLGLIGRSKPAERRESVLHATD